LISDRSGVLILGGTLGLTGASIGGTIGLLKGVDVDIPWQNQSLEEKRAILSQLGSGQYRSRHPIRFSPWIGIITAPHGKTVPNF
jgi:hypothetical protein